MNAQLPHPTPVHIRSCITQRMIDGKDAGKEAPQLWVQEAIREGIKDACREHDAGTP